MLQIEKPDGGGTAVARPLKVLIPLIEEDFAEAEKAGMEYYKAAGGKLVEARNGHFDNDSKGFYAWAEKTFGKKRSQIRLYMATHEVVATATPRRSFKSLEEIRRDLGDANGARSSGRVHREWTAPVDDLADKARREAARLQEKEHLSRLEERRAEADLGRRLIDIGWKVLARELHPDKGGSREAMTRLNRVRDRLRGSV